MLFMVVLVNFVAVPSGLLSMTTGMMVMMVMTVMIMMMMMMANVSNGIFTMSMRIKLSLISCSDRTINITNIT